MVHVTSSQRSLGDEAEGERIDVMAASELATLTLSFSLY
jgi:hypothetical protein